MKCVPFLKTSKYHAIAIMIFFKRHSIMYQFYHKPETKAKGLDFLNVKEN